MDHTGDFAPILRAFMARAGCYNRDLAQMTGIALRSIENWRSGEVRRPQVVTAVLKIARALALDAADADAFLRAAAHPPLAYLRTQAQQTGDTELQALLDGWHYDTGFANQTDTGAKTDARPPMSMRHQLRPPIADFVGRAHELDQLLRALRTAAATGQGAIISGVQGMGGVGKTELAYAVAHHLHNTFPDAQIVLELRGSRADPLTATQALLLAIHACAPEAALPDGLPALERCYRSLLHGQRVLILADDAGDAAQVRPLIPPAGCALLITSRQRFSLPGMLQVQLDPLDADMATALLCSICPRLQGADARALAEACGYLPLALRISGSILHNTPALSASDYLARLADERQRLHHLRDPDDPQLDAAASLGLSYTALDPALQRVLQQLGVFVADFATELASAVVVEAGQDVADALHRLLRRNLIMYDAERGRWRLHDLVRAFALDQLETAEGITAVCWRYAQAAMRIAQATETLYRAGGNDTLVALAHFDAERPHIDEARRWATSHEGMPEADTLLVQDALAIHSISHLRYDARQERLPQLQGALAAAQRLGDQRRVGQLLIQIGFGYADVGAPRQVRHYAQQALAIARTIGDWRSELRALACLGIAHGQQGAFQQAISYLEQALIIAQEQHDQIDFEVLLANLGRAHTEIGMFGQALHYLDQARSANRAHGQPYKECLILASLSHVYIALHDAPQAIAIVEHALTRARAIQSRRGEATLLCVLGQARAVNGDPAGAVHAFEPALTMLQEVGDRWNEAKCQWHLGMTLAQQGERERALPLLRAAVAYEQEIGHLKTAEHTTLIAGLEAGEEFSAEVLPVGKRRAVGGSGSKRGPADADR